MGEVINSQRALFNDFDFPYYAISLIEADDQSSMGGTRLSDSFTAFLPRGMHKNDYYIKGKGDPDQIITIKTTAGTLKFKTEHYSKIGIYQLKTDLLAQQEKQFNKFFGIK